MSNNTDFSIQVGIQLEDNGQKLLNRWGEIKQQIEKEGLNINFGKNIQDMLKPIIQASSELSNLQKQINVLNNNRSVQIVNTKDLMTQINEIKDFKGTIEEIKKELTSLGEVTIKSGTIDDKGIQNYIATIKKANGEIAQLKYQFENTIKDKGNSDINLFKFDGIKSITDGTDKVITDLNNFKIKYLETVKSISNENLLPEESINKVINSLNSLNESSSKVNFDNVKNQVSGLKNELSTIQKQIEDTEKVMNFSNSMSNNIDNLYANSKGVDLNRLGELSSQNNNLVDYNNVGELQNVKKLYEEILQLKKEYLSQENQQQKAEEQLYNYIFTQEERLKNIRGSYNTKLDTGSSDFGKLETEYNSLIQELEQYRQKGNSLTSEESNNIKTRINDLAREKNSIIEITNTIKQQETALESLKQKFGSLVDLQEINNIKNSIQGLSTSTNFKGDNSSVTNEINELRQLATERQRLSNMGKVVGTSSDLNVGSSTREIENFLKSTVSYKAQITSINEEIDTLGNRIKTVSYNIANGNQIDRFKLSIDESTGSVRNLSQGMQDLSSKHATFSESMRQSIDGLLRFTIAGTALFGTFEKIKEGISFMNDLNKAQTNIQMITGSSSKEVEQMTQDYSNLASQLHETTSSIMTASEEFLRAGNNAKDTEELLKSSTVMSKIAGQSQQESAQSLIAIMNSYHMNASDMMSVVDKMVAVD